MGSSCWFGRNLDRLEREGLRQSSCCRIAFESRGYWKHKNKEPFGRDLREGARAFTRVRSIIRKDHAPSKNALLFVHRPDR